MTVTDPFLQANADYAAGFDKGDLPSPPARRVAVVTCMDARLIPSRFLGLEEGDAHVIANAGGRAPDVLRSLVVSQRLLGTNEVLVIQHTGCGMSKYTNEAIREKVEQDLGVDAGHIDFMAFADLEQSVRDDVRFLVEAPLIGSDVSVRGFVYDVTTGRLAEVV